MESKFGTQTLNEEQKQLLQIITCNVNQTNEDFIFSLITLAFNPDIDLHFSTTAYILLNKVDSTLIKVAFDKLWIFSIFTSLFSREKLEPYIPSRIASFLFHFLYSFPAYSSDCLGFFSKLLQYISDESVYNLFTEIFNPECNNKTLQNLLVEANFPEQIIISLRDSHSDEEIIELLHIISIGAKNPLFKKQFRTPQLIELLINLYNSKSETIIKNHLWSAIFSITSKETISQLSSLISLAIDTMNFKNYSQKQTISLSMLYSVKFIGKVIKYHSSDIVNRISEIIQHVLILFVYFPDHSLLMNAIFKLIHEGFLWESVSQMFIDNFIPIITCEAVNKERNAATANCMKLLIDMEKEKKNCSFLNKLLSKNCLYKEFKDTYYEQYYTKLNKHYGGCFQQQQKTPPLAEFY